MKGKGVTTPTTTPIKKRFFSVGLRNKVLLPAVSITVLTAALLTVEMASQIRAIIYQDQTVRGLFFCDFLVFDAKEKVVDAKPEAAREYLQEYQTSHGISYIYVLDGANKVLAHTFEGEVPPAIQKLVAGEAGKQGLQKTETSLEGKPLLDIGAPMPDAPGSVHIGMDLSSVQKQVSKVTLNALGTVLLILVAGVALLWYLMDRSLKPIKAFTGIVRKIVGEGDLTQKIEIRSSDEVGQMAGYFNEMMEWLRQTQTDLLSAVRTLDETVKGLEALSEAQNQSVTLSATALQQTQVTAQEIKQTSQTAAQKAEEILKATQKADDIGKTGQDSVERSLQGLTDIRRQVGEIAEKVLDLTDRTRQIGTITNTVKDLADQSNILAINAAIEAVRSGEHGKGFGLVAKEIRRLSDQSLQATGRVKEILDNIQDAIDKVVTITESGSKRMEGGLTLVKSSGENLKLLTGFVRGNSDSVKQIATAVSQQNTGIGQIFSAVTEQTKMMTETVRQVESIGQRVKALKETSRMLTEVSKRYKV